MSNHSSSTDMRDRTRSPERKRATLDRKAARALKRQSSGGTR